MKSTRSEGIERRGKQRDVGAHIGNHRIKLGIINFLDDE